jgi:hypothetical protein
VASQTSQLSTENPPVELAGVEVLPERPRRPMAVVPPTPIAAAPENRSSTPSVAAPPSPSPSRWIQRQEAILDMFQVFASILAVRFLLFLSLIGAFVLALQAMDRQTIPAIAVLVCYSILIIAPLVWLEVRGKTPLSRG